MMTHEEILAMPAGRKMDALVAEAMGCALRRVNEANVCGCNDERHALAYAERTPKSWLRRYSIDIRAAWEVVEFMQMTHGLVLDENRGFILFYEDQRQWYCEFAKPYWESAFAPTVPLAICRAFLLATLEELEEDE